MKKVCSLCNKEKDTIDFYANKKHLDGLQSRCKECKKLANHQYYLDDKDGYINKAKRFKERRVERVRAIKASVGCLFCPEKEPCCLDFHHPNDDKEMNVAKAPDVAWHKVEAEINKCIVVCKNCHAKIHMGLLRV